MDENGKFTGEVLYTSPKGSGSVLRTYSMTTREQVDSFAVGRILADEKGYRVELLGVSDIKGTKSPDARIEGRKWEIKTNKRSTYSSISNLLRKAKKQSPNVILHITSSISEVLWRKAVFDRFSFRDSKSKSFQLQNIIIITNDDRVLHYERREILEWNEKRPL